MKKQEGFALISAVLIVLTIVGFGSVFIAEAVQKNVSLRMLSFFIIEFFIYINNYTHTPMINTLRVLISIVHSSSPLG